ncbi:phosphopantetheine-binding protein [Streptomyces sp. NBC_00582]|uniref:phosphopantetheine-binding protein n=1 Tax=Streptomyces sp. NBC_00582 TaxID=2975783 RepID=UPI001063D187|nr:phosphopantetheine-binding protein [Streptomyces sp. NBC_00582]WUB63916.1 phosphopantetheine-binding protein [Streptomyces sp. NBC_00582]
MTGEELQSAVRTIWREVLGADVADDTDFFDAGGTSFAALRIVAMLDDRHGTPTPVKVLFDNSRFADFVAAI